MPLCRSDVVATASTACDASWSQLFALHVLCALLVDRIMQDHELAAPSPGIAGLALVVIVCCHAYGNPLELLMSNFDQTLPN